MDHAELFVAPLVAFAGCAALYALRARGLARRGRGVPGWRIACFAGGVLVAAAAVTPPFDGLADEHLDAHMAQHVLLTDVAAIAVALGLTGPVLAPLLKHTRLLRSLAHPLVAFALWAGDLALWHVPALYEAAVRHDLLHTLEHALFFWLAVNLWVAVLGPLPKPAWFTTWARLGYVVAAGVVGSALANLFIWSQTAFYPVYGDGVAAQRTGGALMMVSQTVLTLGLIVAFCVRLGREDGERQALLELGLTETRAARAAAAGAGDRLRARLPPGPARAPAAPAQPAQAPGTPRA